MSKTHRNDHHAARTAQQGLLWPLGAAALGLAWAMLRLATRLWGGSQVPLPPPGPHAFDPEVNLFVMALMLLALLALGRWFERRRLGQVLRWNPSSAQWDAVSPPLPLAPGAPAPAGGAPGGTPGRWLLAGRGRTGFCHRRHRRCFFLRGGPLAGDRQPAGVRRGAGRSDSQRNEDLDTPNRRQRRRRCRPRLLHHAPGAVAGDQEHAAGRCQPGGARAIQVVCATRRHGHDRPHSAPCHEILEFQRGQLRLVGRGSAGQGGRKARRRAALAGGFLSLAERANPAAPERRRRPTCPDPLGRFSAGLLRSTAAPRWQAPSPPSRP